MPTFAGGLLSWVGNIPSTKAVPLLTRQPYYLSTSFPALLQVFFPPDPQEARDSFFLLYFTPPPWLLSRFDFFSLFRKEACIDSPFSYMVFLFLFFN